MARTRGFLVWALYALAAGAALPLPSCLFCGGQTGECGLFGRSEDSEDSEDCTWLPRGYAEPSARGETAEQVIAVLGGPYTGTLTCTGTEDVASEPADLHFYVDYAGGPVWEDPCAGDLIVSVVVTIATGDGTLARSGAAELVGSPASASLLAELPWGGDDLVEDATFVVTLTADGAASGRLAVDNETPMPFTATRQP
ncbi:MAG: hypothetical protein JW751_26900 [Polyangiaceae bacterium]|nr:hypothetical protein [Polyangiaceae bacterium]